MFCDLVFMLSPILYLFHSGALLFTYFINVAILLTFLIQYCTVVILSICVKPVERFCSIRTKMLPTRMCCIECGVQPYMALNGGGTPNFDKLVSLSHMCRHRMYFLYAPAHLNTAREKVLLLLLLSKQLQQMYINIVRLHQNMLIMAHLTE